MIKTRHLIFIFIPAILLLLVFVYAQVLRYEPLYPDYAKLAQDLEQPDFVPIFTDDAIVGNRQATKTIIAFEDIACEHCKDQMDDFKELVRQYPRDVKIVWKGLSVVDFPQDSTRAHEYLFCANEQGRFLDFQSQAFANQTTLTEATLQGIASSVGLDDNLLQNCLASGRASTYIEHTRELARSLNITAVPTAYIDGERIDTSITFNGWKTLLGL